MGTLLSLLNSILTEDPILVLFVDLGLAVRLTGEVLGRDLLLRRPLLVILAAHLQQIIKSSASGKINLFCIKQD